MHTNRLILTFAASAIALSACVQKIDEPFVEEMEQFEITAVNLTEGFLESDLDTKISVGEETDATVLYWSPREAVGVYGSRTKNAKFTTTNTVPSQNISLRGNLYLFDSPKYTYYPYNSNNNSNPYTAVKSELPSEQVFDTEEREFSYDFKMGTATSSGWSKYSYSFIGPLTYIRFIINATGSVLEGDRLESVTLQGPDGAHLAGTFKADLGTQTVTWTDDSSERNVVSVSCPNTPLLGAGTIEVIYMVLAPESIQSGNAFSVILRTDNHVATINKSTSKTLVGKTTYKMTMNLASSDMKVQSRMNLNSFGFKVADNTDKILGTELYFNGSKTATRSVSEISLAIDEDNATITGCIPYLYDFKLIPSFDISGNIKAYVDGQEIISGVTEVDFTNPVTLSLKSGDDVKTYTVSVRNTGLPVVVLKSDGTGTQDWSGAGIKVKAKTADWGVADKITVYNADGSINLAEAACGFRLRGNTTQTFPKKPFAIKLDKKANILDIMPDGGKHKRWCLLANYLDRSLMRNAVTNQLAKLSIDAWKNANVATGLVWNPGGEFVELVIDGRHVGNYYLCEQIKIDGDRLDIKDPFEDVVEDGIANPAVCDCGYLMEFDDGYDENFKFITKRGLPCQFKDDINDAILDTLKNKIFDMEQNLKDGNYEEAYKVLDIYSYIDHWLIHELAMNNEYKHPKSVYMYMDGDSTLCAGPVWDFDYQTYPNVQGIKDIHGDYSKGTSYSLSTDAWIYKNSNNNGKWGDGSSSSGNWWENLWGGGSSSTMPSRPDRSESGDADAPYMWIPLLTKDATFRTAVQERWQILKPYWNNIYVYVNKYAEANRLSEEYNFAMWPLESSERSAIRNTNGVNWFVEFSGDERIEEWDKVTENFRNVLSTRMSALDAMITSGNFVTTAK